MTTSSTAELMNHGMRVLVEQLGHIQAEQFISVIIREKFDYTKWHRQLFDGMSVKDINAAAVQHASENPW